MTISKKRKLIRFRSVILCAVILYACFQHNRISTNITGLKNDFVLSESNSVQIKFKPTVDTLSESEYDILLSLTEVQKVSNVNEDCKKKKGGYIKWFITAKDIQIREGVQKLLCFNDSPTNKYIVSIGKLTSGHNYDISIRLYDTSSVLNSFKGSFVLKPSSGILIHYAYHDLIPWEFLIVLCTPAFIVCFTIDYLIPLIRLI